jgi:hypothetical protein
MLEFQKCCSQRNKCASEKRKKAYYHNYREIIDIMRKMLFVIMLFVFYCYPVFVHGAWEVRIEQDSMTDKTKKSAYVRNSDDHQLTIYRISDGGVVWCNFRLSNNSFDQISSEKLPIYRVDKNEPVDLSGLKGLHNPRLGMNLYEWEPKWINFVLWHGKEKDGWSKDLINFMEGQSIVFRYYLPTGGYKETTFSLDGAASSIAKAIDITATVDHKKQTDKQEMKPLITDYVTRVCIGIKSRPARQECFAKVTNCSEQSQNVDELKACLSTVR